VNFNDDEITVVTPHSPLGQELIGKKSGERWAAKSSGQGVKYQIVKVW
jgi:transcription elongation GreA/GreB family factor